MEHVDYSKLATLLPTDKSEESFNKRKKLFKDFDPNGNGYLSLAEVDRGFLSILKIPEVFDRKPVMMRAFEAAKNKCKAKSKYSDDYIEFNEFRIFLIYIRQYLEYFEMFSRLDSNHDKKVSLTEFKVAIPIMEKWGVKVNDPSETFAQIDTNGGGSILFDEFCHWAISKNLDLEDDDDFFDESMKDIK